MKANSRESVYTVLYSFLSSEEMSTWCTDLWNEYPFLFILTKDRKSKLGDYRFDRRTKEHTITLNKTLPRYQFLITYLHEVAHRITQEIHKGRVAPHGKEWKGIFSSLLLKGLKLDYFPSDLAPIIERHAINPKASCSADQTLTLALKGESATDQSLLAHVKEGEDFVFKNKIYTKLKKKRTRSLCVEKTSKRQYLISEIAPISFDINDVSPLQTLSIALKEKTTTSRLILANVKEGEDFVFRNQIYTKLKKRRTRSLCLEKESKQQYLISEIAPISLK